MYNIFKPIFLGCLALMVSYVGTEVFAPFLFYKIILMCTMFES